MYGQEKSRTTSTIAKMNIFLHAVEDFKIVRGDSLRNPAFIENDQLRQFDCVKANPPFSLSEWGVENWASDPFAFAVFFTCKRSMNKGLLIKNTQQRTYGDERNVTQRCSIRLTSAGTKILSE